MQARTHPCLVIPTLNAAAQLSRNETAAAAGCVVIADGGSTDETLKIAAELNAEIVACAPGRGGQLAAGAEAAIEAGAAWLLFLHADTRLGPGWQAEAQAFIDDAANLQRAGVFRFALDDDGAQAKRITRWVAWRNRALALPYGDQGLLISAAFYQRLGGFRPLVLMEDVDLVRRIGRARLHQFEARAITSARRYADGGYLLRPLRNLFCLSLFFLGVPTRLIARIYG